jgi:hypothetical protein
MSGVMRHDLAWSGEVSYGRYGVVRPGKVRIGKVRCGEVWRGLACCGRCGLVG